MINWKKRIKDGGKYIDMQGMPYYFMKWSEKSKVKHVYEYDVIIPEEPADEDCVNYGLPIEDQIFRRTWIPPQVRFPNQDFGKDNWSQKEIDAFIDAEWNRRRNGLWFWIKGEKYYIPGLLWMKMNHWTAITGKEFIYKFSDWEFAVMWMHCVYDPKCKGLIDFKCRQIGDTEWAVLIMWEFGSRVRGTMNTMQSCINEDHVIGTYERLVHGHVNMIYYFKPMNQGTENPKKGLILDYPTKHMTRASVQESLKNNELINRSSREDYEYPPVNSRFKYGPSKITRFDGATGVGRAYCDEFGKAIDMNPIEWLKTMVEATYSNIYDVKVGLILMTSTVEDIGSDSLKWAMQLWGQSDPNDRTSTGATTSGLYRIFRNAVDRGKVDHWGFPLKDEIVNTINETYKRLIQSGDVKGAISYKRKNCLTIEDVFAGANDNSQFDIEKLSRRLFYVQNEAPKSLYVRGNLKWKDGIKDTVVIWEPNSKGRWIISKHPKDFGLKENAKVSGVFAPKPANTNQFCMGVDPFEQKNTLELDPSLGAMAVFAKLDEFVDGGSDKYYQFNDEERGIRIGDPVDGGANFVTNRFVCTYLYRHPDPADFFEDFILTAVYYGTDALVEKNRSAGLFTYLMMRGYDLYKMERPTNTKNYRGQTERDGVTASENTIDEYFSLLTTLSCKWWNTIDHPDLLEQMLTTNYQNRGKKDLSVAAGWALKASTVVQARKVHVEQSQIHHFTENFV